MTERQLFDGLMVAMLVIAALTFVLLLFISAPYGRHTRQGWGPGIRRSVGWLIMETPPVLVVAACFALGDRHTDAVALVFLALWMSHYLHRDLVYPWRMRATDRRMPLLVVGMGVVFNLANGYLQGRWLFSFAPQYDVSWLWDPRFVFGTAIFVTGFAINQHADSVLRALGRSGGYGIPQGGAYRWVSCPNYLGELIEWIGWAILTWSLPGLVFVVWTAANLVPRARSNHRWYQDRFADYPADRKALIPYTF
jgi:3-oxo-5-alpha-steroid 4-dehydrogenase 1